MSRNCPPEEATAVRSVILLAGAPSCVQPQPTTWHASRSEGHCAPEAGSASVSMWRAMCGAVRDSFTSATSESSSAHRKFEIEWQMSEQLECVCMCVCMCAAVARSGEKLGWSTTRAKSNFQLRHLSLRTRRPSQSFVCATRPHCAPPCSSGARAMSLHSEHQSAIEFAYVVIHGAKPNVRLHASGADPARGEPTPSDDLLLEWKNSENRTIIGL